MSKIDEDADLFATLAPSTEDQERAIGTIDGPPGWQEGLCVGLRVWCGAYVGWRDFGDLLGSGVSVKAGTVTFHRARLRASLTFDLGAHSIPRPRGLAMQPLLRQQPPRI